MAISISSRKAKGRKLQQHLAKVLLEICVDVGYQLTADDIRSTSMGVSGADLQLSSKAMEIIPFDSECKNHADINVITTYWDLVEKNKRPTVAVFKRTDGKNRKRSRPEMYVMDEQTFKEMFTMALKYKKLMEEEDTSS